MKQIYFSVFYLCTLPLFVKANHFLYGKYFSGFSFKTLEHIGIRMCVKECIFHGSTCASINYDLELFQCDLNSETVSNNPTLLKEKNKSMYSERDSWTIDIGSCSSIPCQKYERCIPTSSGFYCLRTECQLNHSNVKNTVQFHTDALAIGSSLKCVDGFSSIGQTGICPGSGIMKTSEFKCYSVDDDWILVYRGQNGNGLSDYDVYYDTGTSHETNNSIDSSCTSFVKSTTCLVHYRTSLIDSWSTLNIQQVKFAIYKNGSKVHDIIFNGTSSTSTDWFSKDRIISSSWTDISPAQTYNYFSISGNANGAKTFQRRWHVSHSYAGCPNDYGWFVASFTTSGGCDYDKYSTPSYIVCSGTSMCNFLSDGVSADVMAIFIKTS